MALRFPRGTMAVLLSATMSWVISCAGEQQPETPPTTAQAQDTVVPPHLRAFAADTSAPFIAVVRNELAHALERHRDDKAVNPTSVTDTALYVQALNRALNRIDVLLGGKLKPRLVAVGFNPNIGQPYLGIQFLLARATPGWEANDEQGLIRRQGGVKVYAGIRAIHTTDEADAIDTDAEFDNGQFHKLALIESWKEQPEYQPLGIPRAYDDAIHCLYVSVERGFLMAPPCNEASYPVDSPPAGVQLTLVVKRTQHSTYEVPPVSRWEWSDNGNHNTIGVRCGKSWCQIAKDGFNPAHHESPDPSPDEPNEKYSHVLGWYDVQFLAMMTTSELRPAGPRGLIRPKRALEDELNHPTQPVRDRFVMVAEVMLVGPPAQNSKYDQWGLGNGMNRLGICHGSKAVCEAAESATLPDDAVCIANTGSDGRRWYLRVTKGNAGQPKYHCLHFHQDEPAAARFPSLTRWMWSPTDEGMWFRCPQGCCQKT